MIGRNHQAALQALCNELFQTPDLVIAIWDGDAFGGPRNTYALVARPDDLIRLVLHERQVAPVRTSFLHAVGCLRRGQMHPTLFTVRYGV
jgi:hypothetical protein